MQPEHDDWFAVHWSDLQLVLRHFKVMPPRLTVGEIRALTDDLVALGRGTTDEPDLYALEQLLDKNDVSVLSLWTVFKLYSACQEIPKKYDPMVRSAVDHIPLSELGRIIGRHLGRIETQDMVELATMARECGDEMNVLTRFRPSGVKDRLSGQALRALSIKDLRSVLERLSGIVRGVSSQ